MDVGKGAVVFCYSCYSCLMVGLNVQLTLCEKRCICTGTQVYACRLVDKALLIIVIWHFGMLLDMYQPTKEYLHCIPRPPGMNWSEMLTLIVLPCLENPSPLVHKLDLLFNVFFSLNYIIH